MSVLTLVEKRILVTGAMGFIGSHLYRALIAQGNEVHTVSRNPNPTVKRTPTVWAAELSHYDQAEEIFKRARPHVVFHLASEVTGSRSMAAVQTTFQSNLASTVHLLQLATEYKCERIVTVGSVEEPYAEAVHVTVPASPYAAAKVASSLYARMFHSLYQTPVVIARLFMVYGPGQSDHRKLIPFLITSLLRGREPETSSGVRPVDWIYVDDIVPALIRCATSDNLIGQTVDLGSGELITIKEVVETIDALLDLLIHPKIGALPDRPMEQVRHANVVQTYRQIGWQPSTSLTDGLQKTIDWYRQEHRASGFKRW